MVCIKLAGFDEGDLSLDELHSEGYFKLSPRLHSFLLILFWLFVATIAWKRKTISIVM